jgi:hypothetical protein
MKRVWGVLLALALVACAPSQASVETAIARTQAALPTEALSPELSARVQKFLEQGSNIAALTEQGVVYVDFREAVGDVAGTFDLLDATWPDQLPVSVRNDAADAVEGWQLALYLWGLEIGDKDPPVEPSFNRWQDFYAYAGEDLEMQRYPKTLSGSYAGQQYLTFDANISTLMGMGSSFFDEARDGLLELVE